MPVLRCRTVPFVLIANWQSGWHTPVAAKFEALQGFCNAGMTVVAGNDAGLPHTGFGGLWQELEAMVEGGMTAMQAIIAATWNAAKALCLSDRIGSIRPGKQADLILVDGDPVKDISALSKVRMVIFRRCRRCGWSCKPVRLFLKNPPDL